MANQLALPLKMRVIRVIFVVFITFLLRTAFSLLNSIGNVGYDYRFVSSSLLPTQPVILHMRDLLPRSLSCGSYPQGACLPCQPTSILVKVLQQSSSKVFTSDSRLCIVQKRLCDAAADVAAAHP